MPYAPTVSVTSPPLQALEAWWRVHLTEQPVLTDPRGICEFFDVARTAGTPVLALTARDGTMRERTREQLCALGVTFSPVPLKAGAPVSPCMCTLKADAPRQALPFYTGDGLVFCGGLRKDAAFLWMAAHLEWGFDPASYVFVDDLYDNAACVAALSDAHHVYVARVLT